MRLLFLSFLLLVTAGCEKFHLPQDPKNTLEEVRGDTMHVGLIEHAPWAIWTDDGPRGVDVELIRQFAEQLNADIAWVRGGEAAVFEALENWELDLVIAGLTTDSPWTTRVGVTDAYYLERLVVGTRPGRPELEALEGRRVGVEEGQIMTAHYVEESGAVPVLVENVRGFDGPVAGPAWRLRALGFTNQPVRLHTAEHVTAIPPGENGWLVTLERFLHERQAGIDQLLMEASR